MITYNKDSNLEDEDVRVVEFEFITNLGPGTVTVMVNAGVSLDDAKLTLLDQLDEHYTTIELTKYTIIEVIPDRDTPIH